MSAAIPSFSILTRPVLTYICKADGNTDRSIIGDGLFLYKMLNYQPLHNAISCDIIRAVIVRGLFCGLTYTNRKGV